jgi:hypothetical protein
MRPSTSATSSCTRSATGSTPRTSTFSRPPPVVRKNGCTTSSGEASGSPSGPRATPSKYRSAWKASSGSELEPSLGEPLRSTTRLRGCPVLTRVSFRLETSPANSVVATTTSATTPTVSSVRVRRAARLASG